MKPSVEFGTSVETTPVWFGSRMSDGKISIPGGVRVNSADFPAGQRVIASGTILGRTYAEKISPAVNADPNQPELLLNNPGTGFGPIAVTDEDICINWFDHDLDKDGLIIAAIAPKSGNVLYYNFLPQWEEFANNGEVLSLLFDNYVCVYGQE